MTSSPWEIITNWDLPYSQYLEILSQKKEILKVEHHRKFLLFCSHPHCFTHGRGLRQLPNSPELIPFDHSEQKVAGLDVFQINRGGGITFHYPGQIIIYPMVNLNVFRKALMTLTHQLLLITGDTLKEMNLISSYEIPKEVYGLWSEGKKIASVGMGLDHYITEHGLALNFFHDDIMFEKLKQLHPCGISPDTYSSLEKISPSQISKTREHFVELFLNKFIKAMP